MSTLDQRVAKLERDLAVVQEQVEELDKVVNTGDGDRPSLRYRIHQIEQFNAAAKAADAAREAARTAITALASQRERRFTLAIAALNLLVVMAGVVVAVIYRH